MTLADLALGLIGLATFLLPGWIAAQAARVPQPLLAGFVASTVALTSLPLVFQARGISFIFVHCPQARYLAHSAFFRDPGNTLSAMRADDMILLKIVDPPLK